VRNGPVLHNRDQRARDIRPRPQPERRRQSAIEKEQLARAWNLVVTNKVATSGSGIAYGVAVAAVWPDRSNSIFGDVAHEFGHQALGRFPAPIRTFEDLARKVGRNLIFDALVARTITAFGGESPSSLRLNIAPRIYAIPLNPVATTPKP
jgi:hypothetical protein